jgi:hypothetical protein
MEPAAASEANRTPRSVSACPTNAISETRLRGFLARGGQRDPQVAIADTRARGRLPGFDEFERGLFAGVGVGGNRRSCLKETDPSDFAADAARAYVALEGRDLVTGLRRGCYGRALDPRCAAPPR